MAPWDRPDVQNTKLYQLRAAGSYSQARPFLHYLSPKTLEQLSAAPASAHALGTRRAASAAHPPARAHPRPRSEGGEREAKAVASASATASRLASALAAAAAPARTGRRRRSRGRAAALIFLPSVRGVFALNELGRERGNFRSGALQERNTIKTKKREQTKVSGVEWDASGAAQQERNGVGGACPRVTRRRRRDGGGE